MTRTTKCILVSIATAVTFQGGFGQGLTAVYLEIGEALLDRGRHGLAAEQFNKVLDVDRRNAKAHYFIARVYIESQNLRNLDKARFHYGEARKYGIEFKGSVKELTFPNDKADSLAVRPEAPEVEPAETKPPSSGLPDSTAGDPAQPVTRNSIQTDTTTGQSQKPMGESVPITSVRIPAAAPHVPSMAGTSVTPGLEGASGDAPEPPPPSVVSVASGPVSESVPSVAEPSVSAETPTSVDEPSSAHPAAEQSLQVIEKPVGEPSPSTPLQAQAVAPQAPSGASTPATPGQAGAPEISPELAPPSHASVAPPSGLAEPTGSAEIPVRDEDPARPRTEKSAQMAAPQIPSVGTKPFAQGRGGASRGTPMLPTPSDVSVARVPDLEPTPILTEPTVPAGVEGPDPTPVTRVGDVKRVAELEGRPWGSLSVEQKVYVARYRSLRDTYDYHVDRDNYEAAIEAAKRMTEQLEDDWIGPYLVARGNAFWGEYPMAVPENIDIAGQRGYSEEIYPKFPAPSTDPIKLIQGYIAAAERKIIQQPPDWLGADSDLYRVRRVRDPGMDPIPLKYYVQTDYLLGEVSMGLLDFDSAYEDYTRAYEDYLSAVENDGYDQVGGTQIDRGIKLSQDSLNTQSPLSVEQFPVVDVVQLSPYRSDWSARYGTLVLRMPGYDFVHPRHNRLPEDRVPVKESVPAGEGMVYQTQGGDIHEIDMDIKRSLRRAAVLSGIGSTILLLLLAF
jgi:tetratricopeptide (TPR) repeat protein